MFRTLINFSGENLPAGTRTGEPKIGMAVKRPRFENGLAQLSLARRMRDVGAVAPVD
jgi:hypothetical protein